MLEILFIITLVFALVGTKRQSALACKIINIAAICFLVLLCFLRPQWEEECSPVPCVTTCNPPSVDNPHGYRVTDLHSFCEMEIQTKYLLHAHAIEQSNLTELKGVSNPTGRILDNIHHYDNVVTATTMIPCLLSTGHCWGCTSDFCQDLEGCIVPFSDCQSLGDTMAAVDYQFVVCKDNRTVNLAAGLDGPDKCPDILAMQHHREFHNPRCHNYPMSSFSEKYGLGIFNVFTEPVAWLYNI